MQGVEPNGTVGQMDQSTTRPISTGKPRGRRTAKDRKPAGPRRIMKLTLDPDTIENLNLHAMRAGQSVSTFVKEMVAQHCTTWVIHAKGGPKPGPKPEV